MIFDQLDFKEEKVMDNEKIEKLQQMIDESNHIVFFGGAGVSTESHIPDFRSTDGLYHQTYKYPPEVMVSHTFYTQHTEEFYDFYKNKMIFLDAKPNKAHLKLAEMVSIQEVGRRLDYKPVRAEAKMEDLMEKAMEQNFVPVVDDQGNFSGIITRKDIIGYFYDKLVVSDKEK